MTLDADLGGYAEVRGMYLVDVEGTPWTSIEKVRPTFEISSGDRVRAVATVEGVLAQGRETSDELALFLENSAIGPDLDEYCARVETYHFEGVQQYLTVERLYVDFTGEKVDFRLGRQAVNWGSALVFHPSDLIHEVVASEPWRERRGVNAVRANIAPAANVHIVTIVALGDDLSAFEKTDAGEVPEGEDWPLSGAAKVTVHAAETDWSAVGNYNLDGRWFAGADLKGQLELGWWVEGGWHGDLSEVDPEGAEVVVGLDYSIPVLNRVFLAAEYRYDGTGEPDPEDYDYGQRSGGGSNVPFSCPFSTTGTNEEADAAVPSARVTLGQHYVHGTLNVTFADDWTVGAVAIVNVQDGTGLLVPDAAVVIGERWQVHVGALIPVGESGEFVPPADEFDVVVGANTVNLAGFLPAATLNTWARYSF